MSASRPPSPPRLDDAQVPISVEISVEPSSPKRTSSTDSIISNKESDAKNTRKSAIAHPTNTLIITPLPLAFFEARILDALKSHFASFSTTFLHRRSPYSPVSALGPGASLGDEGGENAPSPSGDVEEIIEEQTPEGDLYAFVPLKSFRRAIVVFYSAEDAERARIESDRLCIPETGKCPAVTLRAFRAPDTILAEESWFTGSGRNKAISDDVEEGSWYFGGFPAPNNFDDTEIRESPFHLRPPVPERNFLISPPGSPPVGWVPAREDPPNETPLAQDLVEALERVKAESASRSRKRRRAISDDRSQSRDRKRSHSVSTATSGMSTDDEHSGLLIPEGSAGLSVRVENWSTTHLMRLDQARELRRKGEKAAADQRERDILSEMEEELDQDLDDGRYRVSMVDWNRVDHARTVISTDLNDEYYEEADRVSSGARDVGLGFHRGTDTRMPKFGMKPKPASLPPIPMLDVPGPDQYKPTVLPPMLPTAMPPVQPALADSGVALSSTVEPSSTAPRSTD